MAEVEVVCLGGVDSGVVEARKAANVLLTGTKAAVARKQEEERAVEKQKTGAATLPQWSELHLADEPALEVSGAVALFAGAADVADLEVVENKLSV